MTKTEELETLAVRLTGNGSSYMRMINTAVKATQVAAKKIQAAGRQMQMIGAKMTLAITLPVAGMIKSYADFDNAMTKSTAIMSGVTDELRKKLEDTALQISRNSTTSANELAASYYFLASAGLDATKSMAALGTVEQFATAGAFDMSTATDLLTDAQSALGMTSKDTSTHMMKMTKVSDLLVKANTLANASVQQFSESLTNEAGAAIKQYNMDVEEGIAILATYADQGIKGNVAGSMMSRMTRLLIKAINDNGSAFKKLNIDVEEFATTGKNVTGIIEGITAAVEGMGPAQKAATLESLGFQARVQAAILPLLGATDAIRGYDKALRDAGGTTEEIAKKQLESFTSQLKILWNRLNAVFIIIGKQLAPYITILSNALSRLVEFWHSLSEEAQASIGSIIGVLAVLGPVIAIVGSVVAAVGGLVAAFGFLSLFGAQAIATIASFASTVGLWVGLIGMAVIAVKMLVDAIWGDGSFMGALGAAATAVGNFAMKAIGFMVNIRENWGMLTGWLKDNWVNILKDVGMVFVTYLSNMSANAGVAFNTLIRLFSLTIGTLKRKWKELFEVDFGVIIVAGLIKAYFLFKKFIDKARGMWEALKDFDFGQAGAAGDSLLTFLTDSGEQMSKDAAAGEQGLSYKDGVSNIIDEQLGKLKSPLEGFESSLTEMPDFQTDIMKFVDLGPPTPTDDSKAAQEGAAEDAVKKVGGGTEAAGNDFKQMSLARFSVGAIGGVSKAVKKQETSDTVVAGKLDELIQQGQHGPKPTAMAQ